MENLVISLLRRRLHSPSALSFNFIMTMLLIFNHLKCEARDTINVKNPLSGRGETLFSAGNKFQLGFFTPRGNEKQHSYVGIWYYELSPRTIVWVANRNNPVFESCGVLRIADDGNIEICCNDEVVSAVTNLGRSTSSNRTLQLLDSGNLVLYDGPTRLWQSFDVPTDTILPGMEINDDMKLTSWISPSDPAPGNFSFSKDQGVYTIQKGSTVYWKSGEKGPLGTFLYNELPSFVAQILSDYQNYSRDYSTRLLMTSSGQIQYFNYSFASDELWAEPRDACSIYDACGKFAICNVYNMPVCHCLRGFKPTSSEEWTNGIYSDGCKRESISSQDDGFLNLNLTKIGGQVPLVTQAQEEATCKKECLNNTQCEAYIYIGVNNTSRETRKSVADCYIWTDLENLRSEDTDDGLHISLRVSQANFESRICHCVSSIPYPLSVSSIPYPLSTQPNCGDPLYSSFFCNSSTSEISFSALSGDYKVIGFNPEKRRFVISVDFNSALTCNDTTLTSQFVKLNQSLPFYVTNWCYNVSANPRLQSGNQIGIGWKPPLEPVCNKSVDCTHWPNSDCQVKGNGQRRCHCNQGYRWDDLSVNCIKANSKNRLWTRYVIILTVLLVGVTLVFCLSYILYRRRRKMEGSDERARQVNDMMHEKDKGVDVPFYDLGIILSATDNFSDANKLGRGGFGPVYKGKLPGEHEIAVKRLSSCSGQGIDEFLNEVNLISKLQHRNLVRLLGYCIQENEKILLYEYMPNRSLDALIFDQNDCLLLDWKKRFDIILGIARGLLYLHQDSRLRIIHRDLKTSNILLDEEMNPKISDFGLARIIEGKRTEASTNKVIGTFGYMSPEYAMDGKFSIKSDVFSFGVVILEIVSGKKNTGFYHPQQVMNLLGYAWKLWSENKALDLLDPKLMESCEKYQVIASINVGLLCVQEDPNDRPSMSTVVTMLDSENTTLPTPTQPAFVMRRRVSISSSTSTSTKPDIISNNEMTISMAQGR